MSRKDNEVKSPSLSPIRKRHWWVLNEEWRYHDISIPAGFTTDLDSVPHIPGIFALYKGRSRVSALGHDYLYALGERPRKDIDRLFLQWMLEDDVPKWIALSMYYAVRLFGWRYYKRSDGTSGNERFNSRMIDETGTAPFLRH